MTSATLAAGAAIWRPPADPAEDAEVLLVHRPKYDDWSLPKGKSDPDEHILLTAVREVWEEPAYGRYLARGCRPWSTSAGACPSG